jgi:hemerythrin-like domain-containing protein
LRRSAAQILLVLAEAGRQGVKSPGADGDRMKSFPGALPGFDEPLEMLEACHERIEAQLDTLERLVPHLAEAGPDDAAREAARRVMRYFDTAGAHHHRDEDEDLFPRLRAIAACGNRTEIGGTLYELEQEHAAIGSLYARLRAQLAPIAAGEVDRLDAELVVRFAWSNRRHISLEAEVVLPYAREVLDSAQRVTLGERMAARRLDRNPRPGHQEAHSS